MPGYRDHDAVILAFQFPLQGAFPEEMAHHASATGVFKVTFRTGEGDFDPKDFTQFTCQELHMLLASLPT